MEESKIALDDNLNLHENTIAQTPETSNGLLTGIGTLKPTRADVNVETVTVEKKLQPDVSTCGKAIEPCHHRNEPVKKLYGNHNSCCSSTRIESDYNVLGKKLFGHRLKTISERQGADAEIGDFVLETHGLVCEDAKKGCGTSNALGFGIKDNDVRKENTHHALEAVTGKRHCLEIETSKTQNKAGRQNNSNIGYVLGHSSSFSPGHSNPCTYSISGTSLILSECNDAGETGTDAEVLSDSESEYVTANDGDVLRDFGPAALPISTDSGPHGKPHCPHNDVKYEVVTVSDESDNPCDEIVFSQSIKDGLISQTSPVAEELFSEAQGDKNDAREDKATAEDGAHVTADESILQNNMSSELSAIGETWSASIDKWVDNAILEFRHLASLEDNDDCCGEENISLEHFVNFTSPVPRSLTTGDDLSPILEQFTQGKVPPPPSPVFSVGEVVSSIPKSLDLVENSSPESENFIQRTVPSPVSENFIQRTVPSPVSETFIQGTVPSPVSENFIQRTVSSPVSENLIQGTVPSPVSENFIQRTVSSPVSEICDEGDVSSSTSGIYTQGEVLSLEPKIFTPVKMSSKLSESCILGAVSSPVPKSCSQDTVSSLASDTFSQDKVSSPITESYSQDEFSPEISSVNCKEAQTNTVVKLNVTNSCDNGLEDNNSEMEGTKLPGFKSQKDHPSLKIRRNKSSLSSHNVKHGDRRSKGKQRAGNINSCWQKTRSPSGSGVSPSRRNSSQRVTSPHAKQIKGSTSKNNNFLERLKGNNADASQFIGEYLFELWKNECLCDVKIQIGAQSFLAHRIVLAAFSDVFCPAEPMPTPNLVVNIPNSSTNAVYQILQYLYTSEMEVNDDTLEEILSAAMFLGVTDVVEMIKGILANPSADTVVHYMDIANRMRLSMDIADYPSLFREFLLEIWDTPTFKNLTVEKLIAVLKDQAIAVESECDLLVAMCKWVEADLEGRQKHVPDLLQHINFVCMSPLELSATTESFPHVFDNTRCQTQLAQVYKSYAVSKIPFESGNEKQRKRRSEWCSYANREKTNTSDQQNSKEERCDRYNEEEGSNSSKDVVDSLPQKQELHRQSEQPVCKKGTACVMEKIRGQLQGSTVTFSKEPSLGPKKKMQTSDRFRGEKTKNSCQQRSTDIPKEACYDRYSEEESNSSTDVDDSLPQKRRLRCQLEEQPCTSNKETTGRMGLMQRQVEGSTVTFSKELTKKKQSPEQTRGERLQWCKRKSESKRDVNIDLSSNEDLSQNRMNSCEKNAKKCFHSRQDGSKRRNHRSLSMSRSKDPYTEHTGYKSKRNLSMGGDDDSDWQIEGGGFNHHTRRQRPTVVSSVPRYNRAASVPSWTRAEEEYNYCHHKHPCDDANQYKNTFSNEDEGKHQFFGPKNMMYCATITKQVKERKLLNSRKVSPNYERSMPPSHSWESKNSSDYFNNFMMGRTGRRAQSGNR